MYNFKINSYYILDCLFYYQTRFTDTQFRKSAGNICREGIIIHKYCFFILIIVRSFSVSCPKRSRNAVFKIGTGCEIEWFREDTSKKRDLKELLPLFSLCRRSFITCRPFPFSAFICHVPFVFLVLPLEIFVQ